MTKKECPRCLFTSDIAIIPEGGGQCNYCDLHDDLEKKANPLDLDPALDKIRKIPGQYNCLIGISGGLDSSTLLYAAVREWGLRPMVIHFDNGWNNKVAAHNMKRLIDCLGVNAITYFVDKKEYDQLNDAFLIAGVPDADIPNDIAMTKLMYDTADKYGIEWILNGHDFRTEGSTPASWTYMDAKYIESIYYSVYGRKLRNYPLLTFWDQIYYGLKGIKQVRPFHFGFNREVIEWRMKQETGWQSYGAKHCENIYTEFVGSFLLPNKFNIDKRRVYLSARIRTGTLDKQTAKAILQNNPVFDFEKLGQRQDEILSLTKGFPRERSHFKKYSFKSYKFLIFVLAKLKIVPWTFYVKYAK